VARTECQERLDDCGEAVRPNCAITRACAAPKGLHERHQGQLSVLHGLRHPNLVQLLGYEETTINLNVLFDYIPGGGIGGVINMSFGFSEDVMKSFTSQILCGLEYLYWRGIWHGNLHILVDSMGICKLSSIGTRDFTGAYHFERCSVGDVEFVPSGCDG